MSFTVALTFLSCGNDEIMTYEGNDVIYYKWAVEGVNPQFFRPYYTDSTNITFAYELPEVEELVFDIPIKVQGTTRAFDREVNVVVMESSTAQRDVHFSIPAQIAILADSINGNLPVTLYRTEDMKMQSFSIKLALQENENFKNDLMVTTTHDNGERLVSYTEFEIVVSDILLHPKFWPTNYLGAFSTKKLYLWAEVLQVPVPDWNSVDPSYDSTFSASLSVFKQYLTIQELRGTPVLEDDGSLMELGPYAAYY
ncbi:hypothetical protein GCM10023163_20010 [Aestuariibaculum suncheonense]